MHGSGVYIWKGGSRKYTGNFVNDERHDQRAKYFVKAAKITYVGEWRHNKIVNMAEMLKIKLIG